MFSHFVVYYKKQEVVKHLLMQKEVLTYLLLSPMVERTKFVPKQIGKPKRLQSRFNGDIRVLAVGNTVTY